MGTIVRVSALSRTGPRMRSHGAQCRRTQRRERCETTVGEQCACHRGRGDGHADAVAREDPQRHDRGRRGHAHHGHGTGGAEGLRHQHRSSAHACDRGHRELPRPVARRQSFRMSKTDLAARPIFARTRDAIETRLTIVFTALARVPRRSEPNRPRRYASSSACWNPLRSATIEINGVITPCFRPRSTLRSRPSSSPRSSPGPGHYKTVTGSLPLLYGCGSRLRAA